MSQTPNADHQLSEFRDDVRKIGDDFTGLKAGVSDMAHHAAAAAKDGAHEISEEVKKGVQAGKKGASDAIAGLSETIAARPLMSVAVAVGVGMGLSLLLFRGRA